MNNLASALRETGRMDEARKYFEEVLVKVEKVAGVDHPLYGAALNNCALTLEAQSDFKTALKMHEKSLSLRIRALGPDHPDVALSMHNLGVCLLRDDKVKNLEKATDLGKKALAIWEKTLGPKHPTVVEAKRDWKDLIKT
jgi:tetratricopeptide (TPR) repeat protein